MLVPVAAGPAGHCYVGSTAACGLSPGLGGKLQGLGPLPRGGVATREREADGDWSCVAVCWRGAASVTTALQRQQGPGSSDAALPPRVGRGGARGGGVPSL